MSTLKVARLFTYVDQASSGCFVPELDHALGQTTLACSRDVTVCSSVVDNLDTLIKLIVRCALSGSTSAHASSGVHCNRLLATVLQSSAPISPTRLWRYLSILAEATSSQPGSTTDTAHAADDFLLQVVTSLCDRLVRRRFLRSDLLLYAAAVHDGGESAVTVAAASELASGECFGGNADDEEDDEHVEDATDAEEGDDDDDDDAEDDEESGEVEAAAGPPTSDGTPEQLPVAPTDCLLRLPRESRAGGAAGATRGCMRSCGALIAAVLPRLAAAVAGACRSPSDLADGMSGAASTGLATLALVRLVLELASAGSWHPEHCPLPQPPRRPEYRPPPLLPLLLRSPCSPLRVDRRVRARALRRSFDATSRRDGCGPLLRRHGRGTCCRPAHPPCRPRRPACRGRHWSRARPPRSARLPLRHAHDGARARAAPSS